MDLFVNIDVDDLSTRRLIGAASCRRGMVSASPSIGAC
jgi:hypothetical protein